MPRVSVLIPCHNCAGTLPDTLESVLNQDFDGLEVVAVDDGSGDHTLEVIRSFAASDRRVVPVSIVHGGIVAALNAGLEVCGGEYVARMDGDDICLPGRFSAQAGLLDSDPGLGLASCLVRYGGDREKNRGYAHFVDWTNTVADRESLRLSRFIESPLAHPSVMFRRELVDRHGGYRDGDFPEDYELWLRWMDSGVAMEKVGRELVVWNDPPGRLSRTDPRYDVDAFYRVKARYLTRWLERNNPFHPVVTVIGAGRTSRKRAEKLCELGVRIESYVDIDPRKVGRTVHGRYVMHRDELPEPGRVFCLSYVASRGAREEIEEFLRSRCYAPGRDYLLAA